MGEIVREKVKPLAEPTTTFLPITELAGKRSALAALPSLAPAERTSACPLSPRRRPFGGVCHQCPVGLQAKLTISEPGDEYEQEADRVADLVMRMPEPRATDRRGSDEDERLPVTSLQRSATAPSPARDVPPIVEEVIRSPGQPLDAATRAFFEPRFGYDFGQVRVHTDAQADSLNRALSARAFATGQDIFSKQGECNPSTFSGRELLAHELTHVVQQISGACQTTAFGPPKGVRERYVLQPVPSIGQGEGDHKADRPALCAASPRRIIQRWSAGTHHKITRNVVSKQLHEVLRPDMKIDDKALDRLVDNSSSMDTKLPELWFNIRGTVIQLISSLSVDKERYHNALVSLYRSNWNHALNHGEGGQYWLTKDVAAQKNEDHQIELEEKAQVSFPTNFKTRDRCQATKEIALDFLADALHVAQDRGAHGEGGVGMGHDRSIWEPSFDPDEPGQNGEGYAEAILNTEDLVDRKPDLLQKLLDANHCNRFERQLKP